MPKPPANQRPLPVNRNWNAGRAGAPPFGKPSRKVPRPAPEAGKAELQLELRLPRLNGLPKT